MKTTLLLAGLLSDEGIGIQKVDGLAKALLDSAGSRLADKAKCVGLLGAIERDLRPYKYEVSDPGYAKALEAVQGIFDTKKSAGIEFNDRLEAAEALGQAGDRRLAEDNRITIETGTFRMGADTKDDPEAYKDESPVHEVSLNAYKIGKYPVTVEEYHRFVESDSFGELEDPAEWEEQKLHPNRPVVRVSWHEAAAYCKWTGGRLPTEAEWEFAARGVEGRRYPWGQNDPDVTRANYFGEGGPGRPTPVGLYPLGATPEGICDMAGNVLEWVEDWFGPYDKSPQKNPTGDPKGTSRGIRGGNWVSLPRNLRGAYRNYMHPGDRIVAVGFRCAWEG